MPELICMIVGILHRVRKKRCHSTLASNFAKCYPVFKILLQPGLTVHFWQNSNYIFHHTSNASLHYLVKYVYQE